ncbi:hypothetical protein CR513_33625, partial [Mucuna pruriens]
MEEKVEFKNKVWSDNLHDSSKGKERDQDPTRERVTRKMRNTCHYDIKVGELCMRAFSRPMMKCLIKQADYVIKEIHRGICGMHMRRRAMATGVIRANYYWLTLQRDCT